jgi:lipid-binding SYLF domain-containing protein
MGGHGIPRAATHNRGVKAMNVSKSALVFVLATAMVLKPISEAVASPEGDALAADAMSALQMLYDSEPSAAEMGKDAKAILVFPEVVKIGFMFAGSFGEGVLIKDGKVAGHYSTTSGSYGFQAGAQRYGYAVFLMTKDAVDYLDRSKGWEIGAGPSMTMVDFGRAKKITSTTMNTDAYAVVFGQRGLMAGVGIEGSKISLVDR